MPRTYSSTTFAHLLPGGLPTLNQGADQFAPFPEKATIEKLFSVPEVCQYLRLRDRTVYAAIQEGRLTASWIGRRHMVSESDLAAYVKNQQKVPSWHGKKANVETK